MLARIRKMQEENEEGFTLIELLVVIIIIGILAAIAIPVFLSQRQKGYDSAAKSDLRNFATAEESYLTDFDSYSSLWTDVNNAETVKKSSNVGTIGIALTANASDGYCLGVQSRSGKYFWYDSLAGGLKSSTSTATAPNDGAAGTAACTGQAVSVPGWNS
jgi:type IV pilus assembly protein PilA